MNKSEMDSPKNKSIVIENKKIDNNSSVLKGINKIDMFLKKKS